MATLDLSQYGIKDVKNIIHKATTGTTTFSNGKWA